MDACKMALLSGIEMDIMIPGKPDHPFVMWASLSFLGELLEYGANVHLYDDGFLHAKTLVIDDEIATVGTTNLDARSFRLNFEVNALIFDERVALELVSLFETDTAVCRKYYIHPSVLAAVAEERIPPESSVTAAEEAEFDGEFDHDEIIAFRLARG